MAAVATEIHPARFSKPIIEILSKMIPDVHVHDPYAGDGTRLGALCDLLGVTFSGTEIEGPFIRDQRVKEGNSRKRATYPRRRPYWIVTSPVYPNGIADHFEAKDASKRKTYRQARAKMTGRDQPLHEDNMGAYGYRGTKRGGNSIKRSEYWRIAFDVAQCWDTANAVVLNVSDFKQLGGNVEPLVQDWITMLKSLGWRVSKDVKVKTPRMKHGSDKSREERVDAERVLLFVKAA